MLDQRTTADREQRLRLQCRQRAHALAAARRKDHRSHANSKLVVGSISTITCRIPGKPLKRRGAYAIVTALQSPSARARRKPPIDHRVLARPWFGAANVRPRSLSRADRSAARGSGAATGCERRARRRRGAKRSRSARAAWTSTPRAMPSSRARSRSSYRTARSRRRAPARWPRRQRRRARPRELRRPRRHGLRRGRPLRRSVGDARASRAQVSICRNGRRAARRSRSRSPATAACRSRTCCSRRARRTTSRGRSAHATSHLDINGGVGTARGVKLDFKGVPILYAPYFTFPINDAAQERLPDARHQQARPHGLRFGRAVLPEPRAELRLDARAALHERARHTGAQRLSLPACRTAAAISASSTCPTTTRPNTTRRYANLQHESLFGGSDQLEVLAGSKRSPTTPTSRISAAALSVTSQTHLNRFVDLTFYAPNWSLLTRVAELSDDRSRAHGRRTSVRARAADGVRRPLARQPLDVRLEHGARELRSQRRHDRLAARLDARRSACASRAPACS